MREIFEKVNKIDKNVKSREKRETEVILAGKKPQGFDPLISYFDVLGPIIFLLIIFVAMFYFTKTMG